MCDNTGSRADSSGGWRRLWARTRRPGRGRLCLPAPGPRFLGLTARPAPSEPAARRPPVASGSRPCRPSGPKALMFTCTRPSLTPRPVPLACAGVWPRQGTPRQALKVRTRATPAAGDVTRMHAPPASSRLTVLSVCRDFPGWSCLNCLRPKLPVFSF